MNYFWRIPGWLLVIIIANALAQNPPTEKHLLKMMLDDAETCMDEDYVIFSVALSDLFGKRNPDKVLLLDHTSLVFPPGIVRYEPFGAKALKSLKDVPKEVTSDFDTRNKSGARIEEYRIRTPFQTALLSDDEAGKLVGGGGGWTAFHKNNPDVPGITLISRPGLNADHTRALLYVETSWCRYGGHGAFVSLTKDEGEWKVLSKAVTYFLSEEDCG
jgi:hypothetical protein